MGFVTDNVSLIDYMTKEGRQRRNHGTSVPVLFRSVGDTGDVHQTGLDG